MTEYSDIVSDGGMDPRNAVESSTLSWVKGLIPGQPHWVWEAVAHEIDRRDRRIKLLEKQIDDQHHYLRGQGVLENNDQDQAVAAEQAGEVVKR
jgi:hypothetical protein